MKAKDLYLGPQRDTPVAPCPHCGEELDVASGLGTQDGPKPGDISLCIDCGGVNIFDENLKPRLPTQEENQKAEQNPMVFFGRLAMKLAKGGIYGGHGNS